MKIGILNTDAVKPEFALRHGEYPDMFRDLLTAADPDLEFVTYEVVEGEYPSNIHEVDAFLITGSKLSVYDDVSWIIELKNFVRTLHLEKKKLVGICFGHQLIAEALGGKTRKANVGWCVGVHSVQLNSAASAYLNSMASALGENQCEFKILSNHQDQVEQLPEGGELLGSTETCPMAMTAIGNHILTFQGHPEFSKPYARDLLDMRREILGKSLYQEAIKSLQTDIDNLIVAKWIVGFVAN